MTTCPACQRENEDADFCAGCGYYLRWEATRSVRTADVARREGAAQAPAGRVASPAPAPKAPAPAARPAEPADRVVVVLRLPGADVAGDGALTVRVAPGGQASVVALVRNQTGIVDTFEVRVEGVPAAWVTAAPATVHLLPYGVADEGHEREVEIRFTVPRSPEAEARAWPLRVVAVSRTNGRAGAAEAQLAVAPFVELESELRPERKRGRLRARFAIAARNRGNAPAAIAFVARDAAEACAITFDAPTVEAHPGRRAGSVFWIRPRKQLWIGRPVQHRFTAEARSAAVEAAPSPPHHGVFVQKPWLPWWLLAVIPLIAAGAVAAYLLWPRTVVVPDLSSARTPFQAAERLAEHGLVLGARTEVEAEPSEAGRLLDQSPKPGEKVEEGSEVAYVWGVGVELRRVPKLQGLTLEDAAARLNDRDLELGRAMPSALSPRDRITGQVPRPGDLVRAETPVDLFLRGAKPVTPQVRKPAPATDSPVGEDRQGRVDTSSRLPDLVLDARGELWLVKEARGRPFNLTSTRKLIEEEPAFAPDGRVVAFRRATAEKGRVYLLDITREGAAPRPATADDGRDHGRPSISPDGKVLAFISSPPDPTGRSDSDLCFVPLVSASPPRAHCLADPGTDVTRPAWSADGRRILVVWSRFDGRAGLGMYTSDRASAGDPAAWSALLPLTEGLEENDGERSVLYAAWSHDGKRIAFTASWNTQQPHLFVATLQRNGVALVSKKTLELRGIAACEVAWAGTGEQLVVTARDDDPTGANPCDGGGVAWRLDPQWPQSLHAVTEYAHAANPVWRPTSR